MRGSLVKIAALVIIPAALHGETRADAPSALWAQTLIGSDLARETASSKAQLPAIVVGVIGTSAIEKMAGLVAGPRTGAAEHIRIAGAITGWPVSPSRLVGAAAEVAGSRPAVVAVATGLGDDPAVLSSYRTLARQTILVIPAGDRFPRPVDENTARIDAIRVAGISESGFMDATSQEDTCVDIAAPAGDGVLTDVEGDAGPVSYRGTSAAVGLAAGAISIAARELPGITAKEMRALLKNTALPTLNGWDTTRRNGAGTLNAFKLAAVAKRLRAAGWPASRSRIADSGSAVYDFTGLSKQFRTESARLHGTNDEAARRRRLLRESLLLDFDEPTRAALEAEYRSAGLATEAGFLAAMAPDRRKTVLRALSGDAPEENQLGAIRAAGNLDLTDITLDVFHRALERLSSESAAGFLARKRVLIVMAVSHRGPLDLSELQSYGPKAAASVFEAASIMGRKEYLVQILRLFPTLALDLYPAAIADQADIIDYLVQRGADVNAIAPGRDRSPVMYAARMRNLSAARALLADGADVNQIAPSGETALVLAVQSDDSAMASLLVQNGARTDIGAYRGKNLFELAAEHTSGFLFTDNAGRAIPFK